MGYPACAGIDLRGLGYAVIACGLPRMRGDRPKRTCGPTFPVEATPHARGSTFSTIGVAHKIMGYPACAGIDL